jgi:putative two-component system response regulator
MHDVGKIGIRDNVLLKNGKLNEKEWNHMQQHTIFGCSILATGQSSSDRTHKICTLKNCSPERLLKDDTRNNLITVAKRIALFHHESWNGTGYPFGIAKEKIPIEARIVSLVDVFDAISSKRHYKDVFPENACRDIILEGRGTKFDPAVVDTFFKCLETIITAKDHFLD